MTLYETFGVAENASASDIDAAWKRLMKAYHPDVNPNADPRIAKEINQAHDLLKDPEKRAAYDSWLQESRQPLPVLWINGVAQSGIISFHLNGSYTFSTL